MRKSERHVAWGSVQVLEFHVGLNMSAVPPSGGPPVGLDGAKPVAIYNKSLQQIEEEENGEQQQVNNQSQKAQDQEQEQLHKADDMEPAQVDEQAAQVNAARDSRTSSTSGISCQRGWLSPMDRLRILVDDGFCLADVSACCDQTSRIIQARTESMYDNVERLLALEEQEDDRQLMRSRGSSSSSTKTMLEDIMETAERIKAEQNEKSKNTNSEATDKQITVVVPMATGHSCSKDMVVSCSKLNVSQPRERKKVVLFEGF